MNPLVLDILGQQERINLLYTLLTLCFELPSSAAPVDISTCLQSGLNSLAVNFPWLSGKVNQRDGVFMIDDFQETIPLILKDLSHDQDCPDWQQQQRAGFPFRMLHETVVAGCKTLAASTFPASGLPVFVVQANLLANGLLLTFAAQHGSMDMTGLGQVMSLLSAACRGERFTDSEISVGNMKRQDILPVLDESLAAQEDDSAMDRDRLATSDQRTPVDQHCLPADLVWAYFSFSAPSLRSLKGEANRTMPEGKFVSTDDVLSSFVWQRIIRVRLLRLNEPSVLYSTLSRNVDMRRQFSVPDKYPGFLNHATEHTFPLDCLVNRSLGQISAELRAALEPTALRRRFNMETTRIRCKQPQQKAYSNPELDIRLSSWAKERSYGLDFGFGLPVAVRRPAFTDGAREGLAYLMPKRLDGEIAVAVCLRSDDLLRLRTDVEFSRYSTYIG
ncbi:uncharacterized protein HMPREF1541_07807 [Cyphellophora europaea CBS 101466]|uniref:Trichothecene 3-O-acetyltransferase-like N-terminal domain-containing protein n=1 Tax=Cyphellophora europaea (strain CBS 101466) TaxID=1220924 RepID=W2RKG1_CYPE1|nr:uncharacterized protein HMPREF1541_07807 [Cyphellophora europaea CBS 101466]ETN36820.1 hypothetical protein HMPREF1541_07807 [Cyphellophora europaea CBS 101466]